MICWVFFSKISEKHLFKRSLWLLFKVLDNSYSTLKTCTTNSLQLSILSFSITVTYSRDTVLQRLWTFFPHLLHLFSEHLSDDLHLGLRHNLSICFPEDEHLIIGSYFLKHPIILSISSKVNPPWLSLLSIYCNLSSSLFIPHNL